MKIFLKRIIVKFSTWPKQINAWVKDHNAALGAWSSLVTIISLPLVLVGFFLSYKQLQENFARPELECYLNKDQFQGVTKLEGDTLKFHSDVGRAYDLTLKNVGNGVADRIQLFLLVEKEKRVLGQVSIDDPWMELTSIYDAKFPYGLVYIFSTSTIGDRMIYFDYLERLDPISTYRFQIHNLNFQSLTNHPVAAALVLTCNNCERKYIPFYFFIERP